MRKRGTLGMTLVELMIVVVVIGILAALSVVGYRKWVGRGRLSEASAMLAEFSSKEQLYFLENGHYIEAHNGTATSTSVGVAVSTTENASDFFPHNPSTPWDSARESFPVNPLPTGWLRLGIKPRWNQLYCTYLVNSGCGPSSGPNALAGCAATPGTFGPTLVGAAPNVHWYYGLAACSLQRNAAWPNLTVLALTHESPALRTLHE